MAVKFEFTITDNEAELLMDLIQRGIVSCDEEIVTSIVYGFSDRIEWLRRHKQLIVDLKNRMTNTRV